MSILFFPMGSQIKEDILLIEHDSDVDIFQYVNPSKANQVEERVSRAFESGKYQIEQFPCAICSENADWLQVASSHPIGGARFAWEICRRCGLLQIRSRFDAGLTDLFYSSGDYHSVCMGDISVEEHWNLYSVCAGPALALNLRLLGIDIQRKKVLDTGCGPGAVLNHLKSLGAIVEGFDVDPAVISFGRQFIKEIRLGDANKEKISRDVDIVLLNCVLPHLSDPVSFLSSLRESIKSENQSLILTLPNLDYCFDYSDVSFAKFLHIGHYFYFNAATVERMLNVAGFIVESMVTRGAAMAIRASKSGELLDNENNAFWTTVSAINFMNLKLSRVGKDIDAIAANWRRPLPRRVMDKAFRILSGISKLQKMKIFFFTRSSRG